MVVRGRSLGGACRRVLDELVHDLGKRLHVVDAACRELFAAHFVGRRREYCLANGRIIVQSEQVLDGGEIGDALHLVHGDVDVPEVFEHGDDVAYLEFHESEFESFRDRHTIEQGHIALHQVEHTDEDEGIDVHSDVHNVRRVGSAFLVLVLAFDVDLALEVEDVDGFFLAGFGKAFHQSAEEIALHLSLRRVGKAEADPDGIVVADHPEQFGDSRIRGDAGDDIADDAHDFADNIGMIGELGIDIDKPGVFLGAVTRDKVDDGGEIELEHIRVALIGVLADEAQQDPADHLIGFEPVRSHGHKPRYPLAIETEPIVQNGHHNMTEIEAVELEELAVLARQTVDVLVDGVEHEAEYPLICGFALALFGDLEREGKFLHLAFIRTHRVQVVQHGVPRHSVFSHRQSVDVAFGLNTGVVVTHIIVRPVI